MVRDWKVLWISFLEIFCFGDTMFQSGGELTKAGAPDFRQAELQLQGTSRKETMLS